ncbi:phosphate signaling complex PhoU family protein [Enorma phocaeensis]|uniref:Phosphate uptake regulator PhoU n=1 Tax=Enorma phocaeensis TaxID=1871019 RepID=A0A921IX33_9ACTN|nr:PhoU domain-containing protein [Enorma phocaeensis]HJG37605.1 phosphate uptake regulator PhoU [Enorma phocaeensis]
MRKLFYRQLVEARREMLSIYEAIDLTLHEAVNAFVAGDRKLATKAMNKTLRIDARCANLEALCYNLIATQGPVASDFRLLQTIIYTDFCLQRMCDKVRRIARAAKLRISSDIELPDELIELVGQEASVVYRVMGTAASVLVVNDLGLLRVLNEQEESAHGIYEEFFRAYNRMAAVQLGDDSSYDDLRRVIMVSRYLDRCAQYAIDAAGRVMFLLTGQRMNQVDLAKFDDEDLDALRIPSGEGVLLRPDVDARAVAAIPVEEVPTELKRLIESAVDEDDLEDEEPDAEEE